MLVGSPVQGRAVLERPPGPSAGAALLLARLAVRADEPAQAVTQQQRPENARGSFTEFHSGHPFRSRDPARSWRDPEALGLGGRYPTNPTSTDSYPMLRRMKRSKTTSPARAFKSWSPRTSTAIGRSLGPNVPMNLKLISGGTGVGRRRRRRQRPDEDRAARRRRRRRRGRRRGRRAGVGARWSKMLRPGAAARGARSGSRSFDRHEGHVFRRRPSCACRRGARARGRRDGRPPATPPAGRSRAGPGPASRLSISSPTPLDDREDQHGRPRRGRAESTAAGPGVPLRDAAPSSRRRPRQSPRGSVAGASSPAKYVTSAEVRPARPPGGPGRRCRPMSRTAIHFGFGLERVERAA